MNFHCCVFLPVDSMLMHFLPTSYRGANHVFIFTLHLDLHVCFRLLTDAPSQQTQINESYAYFWRHVILHIRNSSSV